MHPSWSRCYELGTCRSINGDRDGILYCKPDDLRENCSAVSNVAIPLVFAIAEAAIADNAADPANRCTDPTRNIEVEELIEAADRFVVERQDDGLRSVEDGWIASETFNNAKFTLARVVELHAEAD